MSSARKIAARLRTEPTDQLPRLLRLYANDAQALQLIQDEIIRRQQFEAASYQLPTISR